MVSTVGEIGYPQYDYTGKGTDFGGLSPLEGID